MLVPYRSRAPLALAAARSSARAALSRARRAPPCWDELAPRTPYARFGRPLLRLVLLALCLPPSLALALPIAVWNARVFGLRRILFRQRRVGRHGRVFWILKFRSMHGDDGACDAWRAGEDGARVTRFGRFLRNTHLDELPQLVNILRGEMDFIGPRPEMLAVDEWARARIPHFEERYAVLPGVTGLAQVTQGYAPRELSEYRRKLELDRLFLACSSFALDLEILARTALCMARGRGWHAAPAPAPAPVIEPQRAEHARR
jgi:lipopolysaccharide/colanic/teichoic acid biosynthesis glycosyltransferase